jgi:hypothetical protein
VMGRRSSGQAGLKKPDDRENKDVKRRAFMINSCKFVIDSKYVIAPFLVLFRHDLSVAPPFPLFIYFLTHRPLTHPGLQTTHPFFPKP